MLKNKFISFILFFLITYSASFIGGMATISFKEPWYSQLIIKKVNLFFGYKAIDKLEIIQKKIDNSNIKKSNNNSKLNNNFKNFDERYKELNKYPDLRKNFQTIHSKITKS